MYLKFIGADGSMRLSRGEIYNVSVKTKDNYIWVIIPRFEFRAKVFGVWECPYSSPQTFSENWAKP